MSVVFDPVETFGPFLIPATLFVVGVAGYLLLWFVTGRGEKWADEQARAHSGREKDDLVTPSGGDDGVSHTGASEGQRADQNGRNHPPKE